MLIYVSIGIKQISLNATEKADASVGQICSEEATLNTDINKGTCKREKKRGCNKINSVRWQSQYLLNIEGRIVKRWIACCIF